MKTALVTGGGNGIGAEICRALVDAGTFVWVNDIIEDRAAKIVLEAGEPLTWTRRPDSAR